jgi:hypothetical protein
MNPDPTTMNAISDVSSTDIETADTGQNYGRQTPKGGRIHCPCQAFAALSKIVNEVLADDDQTRAMIDWLNGDTDRLAMSGQTLLSCGKRYQCRFRYGTSFAILDAIRDACAPFLVETWSSGTATEDLDVTPARSKTTQRVESRAISYDKAFPPLRSEHPALSNILVPPKTATNGKEQGDFVGERNVFGASSITTTTTTSVNTLQTRKKKSKRKIRPQLTTAQIPGRGFGDDQSQAEDFTAQPSATQSAASGGIVDMVHQRPPVTPTRKSMDTTVHILPSNPPTPVKVEHELPLDHLDRLVDVYVALIKNLLVPSTPIQLNLLFQLLSIDPTKSTTQQFHAASDVILFFRPMFSNPSRCIHFAERALTELKDSLLLSLPSNLMRALIQWDRFQQHCPAIVQTLKRQLGAREAEYNFAPPSKPTKSHAIFSLPFEGERDSRHNYKTTAQIALYNNREQARDAFLSHLRNFMTAKSKAFLPQDLDNIRERAHHDSRRILGNIFNANMVWFAQFFCDLLLQVGLSPVEEMDQELLSIVRDDRERLQKLHNRMSGRNGFHSNPYGMAAARGTSDSRHNGGFAGRQRNGKSIPSSRTGTTRSPLQEALVFFPGYQEFFLVFLLAVDSQRFGVYLSQQLSNTISNLISDHSFGGFEKRVMDLQVLGRFLGALIFGPNWHDERLDWTQLKPTPISPDFALRQLDSIDLSLTQIIEDAWAGRYTILVIPCIVEMLKMSAWDSLTQTSKSFRQVLSNLRWIQKNAFATQRMSNLNQQLVSFYLETLFNETVTLPRLTSLPSPTIQNTVRMTEGAEFLNDSKFELSAATVCASNAQMESLSEMILSRTQKKQNVLSKRPSSSIKKLRPSIVGAVLGDSVVQSHVGMESPRGKMLSPDGKKQLVEVATPDETKRGAQNRLEEAFFHQHRSLKAICDFTIEKTLKCISPQMLTVFVEKAIDEQNIDRNFSEKDFEDIHLRSMNLSRKEIQTRLSEKVSKSIQLLGPPALKSKVIQIAVDLSVTRGLDSCQSMLVNMLNNLVHVAVENRKKSLKLQNGDAKGSSDTDCKVEEATTALRALQERFSTNDMKANKDLIDECLQCLTIVADSVSIPSDIALRGLFEAIISLETVAKLVVNKAATENQCDETWDSFIVFLHLTVQLSRISICFAGRITSLFHQDFDIVVQECKSVSKDDRSKVLAAMVCTPRVDDSLEKDQSMIEASRFIEPRVIHFL